MVSEPRAKLRRSQTQILLQKPGEVAEKHEGVQTGTCRANAENQSRKQAQVLPSQERKQAIIERRTA
jgi:hypothetical protein